VDTLDVTPIPAAVAAPGFVRGINLGFRLPGARCRGVLRFAVLAMGLFMLTQVSANAANAQAAVAAPSVLQSAMAHSIGVFWPLLLIASILGATALTLMCARVFAAEALAKAVSAGRGQERERIARDLHDTLIQSIQGLTLELQSRASHLPQISPQRRELESALDKAAALLDEARDRVSGLRRSNICENFTSALYTLVTSHRQRLGPLLQLRVTGSPQRLQEQCAEGLHDMTREALVNACIHAGARIISVQLHFSPECVCIHIRDDGVGMAHSKPRTQSALHFGILGMKERAAQLDAVVNIHSEPGRGTSVNIEVPAKSSYAPPRSAHASQTTQRSIFDSIKARFTRELHSNDVSTS
jgi:signal transduction histidine kinase